MTIRELKSLIKIVKMSIIDANNTGDFRRVRILKGKKYQLRNRLNELIKLYGNKDNQIK